MDAEISLASRTLNNGGAIFVWSNIRGRVLYHNSRSGPFHGEQNFTMTQDQCVFIRGFRVKDDKNHKMQVIRVSYVPEYDDPNSGVVDTIRPSINNENPQHSTHQKNDGLFDASYTTSSSSSLDMIGPPISRENLQLLPYSSSTTLQSNGDTCSLSFMTSPSVDSLMEVPNDIAIIDQATIADMRAVRRQQIKNKILAVGRISQMFQALREFPSPPDFNVANIGMDDPRSFGARDGMDALGVQGGQIRRYIHSFDDARRLDIANERLPEFNPMAFPGPQVPVPSMQPTQPPRGSVNTTPTGEGDVSHDLSQGAVADVPGGWPVVQTEDLRRRSRIGDRGKYKRLAELSTVVEEPDLEIS